MTHRIIVAGCRDYYDYDRVKLVLDCICSSLHGVEIVSGGAKGADHLGEQYARERKLPLKIFPANWEQYGNKAGPIRNKEMAMYGDMCIVFWDGKSKGTKNMIDTCAKLNVPLIIENI